jgi:methylmalonyl-CoA mutase N-terminal domain/subunit
VKWALDGLRQAALGDDPFGKDLLMPHILGCVRAYATLGEIIGVLRETWGEYVEQNII